MINWGLVGCGDIAKKRVAPAIISQPDSVLYAAVSPYPDELSAFTARFSIEKGYASVDDMLEDPRIDAVYIATPVYLHYAPALRSLAEKKHVLVEKPMALNDGECEALIAQAAQSKVHLGVAYFRRFFPKIADVKTLLRERVIGDVVHIHILFHSWYNPSKDDPKYWRVIKSKGGGGPLWDMGSHKLDLLIDLFGMPKNVYASLKTLTHDYEAEDSCTAHMEMANGAVCTASFHWNTSVWADEFVIIGTNGKIIMSPADDDMLYIERPPSVIKGMGSEITKITRPQPSNVHAPLIEDFARAVSDGREPAVSGEEGYKVSRLLSAIEASGVTGKKIYLT